MPPPKTTEFAEILEQGKRLEMPLSLEVLKTAEPKRESSKQLEVFAADDERLGAAG